MKKCIILLTSIILFLSCEESNFQYFDDNVVAFHGTEFQITKCEGTLVFIECANQGANNFKIHLQIDDEIKSFLFMRPYFDVEKEFTHVKISSVSLVLM